jgi:Protein of unknown function (DUF1353)
MTFSRRRFLGSGAALGLCISLTSAVNAEPGGVTFDLNKEDWLDAFMKNKALGQPLHVSRFVERIYYLTKPIEWFPNPGQERLQRVNVPIGFVTDFASVPAPFWPLLPPDGEYTYPAIVHDYLYWDQRRSRAEADEILKIGMEDLRIPRWKIEAIYGAVRVFGGGPWDENARLKAQGEKRCLKMPASADATTRWEDYRKRKDVFCG